MTIRVLVADDQALVRGGLVALLTAAPGFEPVGEASNGREAVEAARRLRPDVALLDIRMPEMDGIEAARHILDSSGSSNPGAADPPTTRVVVLTTFDLDEYVYAALRAGASSFLLKDTPPQRLLSALRAAVAGDVLISPDVTRRLIERYHAPAAAFTERVASLSPRELDVFKLVGAGLSNQQIGGELFLSESTVKTHVKRIMAKLGTRSRAQAVVVAYEAGVGQARHR
jgi:DNA-binding NarL/FixJ family response regulator